MQCVPTLHRWLYCLSIQGCSDAFYDFLRQNLLIIGIIGIIFAIYEVSTKPVMEIIIKSNLCCPIRSQFW